MNMSRHIQLDPKRADRGRRQTVGRRGHEPTYKPRRSTYRPTYAWTYSLAAAAHAKAYGLLAFTRFPRPAKDARLIS